jgi:tetratricopeptide (TPR) repeat protein
MALPRHWRTTALLAAALLEAAPSARAWAQQGAPAGTGQGSVIEQHSAGANSTNIGVINGQVTINNADPSVLAAMAKTFADQISATAEAKAKAQAQAADLAEKLGVTASAVSEFFRILGEQNVPQDKIAERLLQIANHFKDTQGELAALQPDDPREAELAGQAKQALDAGRLDDADKLLDQAKDLELAAYRQAKELREKAQEAEDRHALNAAQLLASRGSVALTSLRYKAAADAFRQAADLLAGSHPDLRADDLSRQADALFRQGDEYGDEAALHDAIAAYRLAQAEQPRDRAPLAWAQMQQAIAICLRTLGLRQTGTERLTEALAALREALEVRTRDQVPLDWATTQNQIGNVLLFLGQRETGTAHLEAAAAAYEAALEERTRERAPLDWAQTQTNLGSVLVLLGNREPGTARIEQAVAAFRAALQERTRDRVPRPWSRTQTDLCWALTSLGQRQSGTANLEAAVIACHAALEVRTRDGLPLEWAETTQNLGEALEALGERETGTTNLEDAVAAYQSALEVLTRDRVSRAWASVTGDQGVALTQLAERLGDPTKAKAAVERLSAAAAVLGDAGDAAATHFWVELMKARALSDRLSGTPACPAVTGSTIEAAATPTCAETN